MIIITGGAGFIGSNLVKLFNANGRKDIIVVDDLTAGIKFKNLVDCHILDYWDKEDFLNKILQDDAQLTSIEAIFHQGACSDTTEWDGRFMMRNNYEYSKTVLNFCLVQRIPFIYASSAAIYGDGKAGFREQAAAEKPLNLYGYSKFLFDEYVRRILPRAKSQIVGLRYFNVYGPREQHKGSMASVAFHLNQQLLAGETIKLFAGSDGYGDGEQRRDFIYVDDVVQINQWFWQHSHVSGIFNVGTGRSQTFNDVAKAVLAWHNKGKLQYIPFPAHLQGHYQSFTEADISQLRKVGYSAGFKDVAAGVKLYLDWLNAGMSSPINPPQNTSENNRHSEVQVSS